jgi:hypothetical protein
MITAKITFSLVVSFAAIMLHVMGKDVLEGSVGEQDYLRQTLLID